MARVAMETWWVKNKGGTAGDMGSETCMLILLPIILRLQVWISPGLVMMSGLRSWSGSVTVLCHFLESIQVQHWCTDFSRFREKMYFKWVLLYSLSSIIICTFTPAYISSSSDMILKGRVQHQNMSGTNILDPFGGIMQVNSTEIGDLSPLSSRKLVSGFPLHMLRSCFYTIINKMYVLYQTALKFCSPLLTVFLFNLTVSWFLWSHSRRL